MKCDVIIPVALYDGGMGEDYFEDYPHISFMPFLHKSILRFIVDDITLDKPPDEETRKFINIIYIMTRENWFKECCNIFKHLKEKDIDSVKKSVFEKNKITEFRQFEIYNSEILLIILGLNESNSNRLLNMAKIVMETEPKSITKANSIKTFEQNNFQENPILFIYGDNILEDKQLSRFLKASEIIFNRCNDKNNNNTAKLGITGLIEDLNTKYLPIYQTNRCGYWIADKLISLKVDDKENIANEENVEYFEGENIIDILPIAKYPDLYKKLSFYNNKKFFFETGYKLFSRNAISELSNAGRDPLGSYSFKQAIREIKFRNSGDSSLMIYGLKLGETDNENKCNDWCDINYPWELLESQDTVFYKIIKDFKEDNNIIAIDKQQEKPIIYPDNNLINSGFILVNAEKLLEFYSIVKFEREKLPNKPGYKHEYLDGITPGTEDFTHWGIDKDAHIRGWFLLEILCDETIYNDARCLWHKFIDVPDIKEKINKEKYYLPKIYIGPGASICGFNVIRVGCRIRQNARVVSSNLGRKTLIDTFALVDHSIIGEGSMILAHATVPYSIIGKNVIVGGDTAIACERLDRTGLPRENCEKLNIYFSDIERIKHSNRFGAVIGDYAKLGMHVFVQPNRKIGKYCEIYPGVEVDDTRPPYSKFRKLIDRRR
jgi:NDP-sugar pyrophosphorylase family protein